jgi:hypothetical protein
MYISLENRTRLGGCSNSTPCIRSRHARINRSFPPSFFPSSRSRHCTNRSATFHSKPSCSLKNSRKAGSPQRSESCLRGGVLGGVGSESRLRGDEEEAEDEKKECRLFAGALVGEDGAEGVEDERQSCASRPSIWRRPLRILELS